MSIYIVSFIPIEFYDCTCYMYVLNVTELRMQINEHYICQYLFQINLYQIQDPCRSPKWRSEQHFRKLSAVSLLRDNLYKVIYIIHVCEGSKTWLKCMQFILYYAFFINFTCLKMIHCLVLNNIWDLLIHRTFFVLQNGSSLFGPGFVEGGSYFPNLCKNWNALWRGQQEMLCYWANC